MSRRLTPRLVTAVAVALLVAAGPLPESAPLGAAETGPEEVTLRGQGSWDVYRAMPVWQDALFGDEGLVTANYLANGDFFGRQNFVDGGLDYVISGVPFTEEQLAELPHGVEDVIAAPIQVAAVSFPVVPSTNNRHAFIVNEVKCDPTDPANEGEVCTLNHEYTGPVRVPHRNLAAMVFNYAGQGGQIKPNSWAHPDITGNWVLGPPEWTHRAHPQPINSSVEELSPVTRTVTVRGNGQLEVDLTWPSAVPNANLDLELLDGDEVVAESKALTGNAESIDFTVEGIDPPIGGIPPETKTLTMKVIAQGVGSSFTLDRIYPLEPHYLVTDRPPVSVVRSEPSALTYYLQQYVKTAANDIWELLKADTPDADWEPITERFPVFKGLSRPGVQQQIQAVEEQLGYDGFREGSLVAVPRPAFGQLAEAAPDLKPALASIQNAAGEWVTPTVDSITAAVDAGGTTPLYALTNPVPDAYPLVYVNYLYAPSTGLSPEEAEALATMIRYLATAGQNALPALGDAKLPAPIRAEALAAANQLVRSNCADNGGVLTTNTDPGVYAPSGLSGLGTVAHCASPPEPAEVGVGSRAPATRAKTWPDEPEATAGTLEEGLALPLDPAAASDPSGDLYPATVAGEVVPQPAAAPLEPQGGFYTGIGLPLPLPFSGVGGYDRMAAVAAGALLVLALRRPASRRVERIMVTVRPR